MSLWNKIKKGIEKTAQKVKSFFKNPIKHIKTAINRIARSAKDGKLSWQSVASLMTPFGWLGLVGHYLDGKTKETLSKLDDYQIKKFELPEPRSLSDPEWYAGGKFYGACFAGGVLFNPSGLMTPFEKITHSKPYMQGDKRILEQLEAPYERFAGGNSFYDFVCEGSPIGKYISR